MLFFFLFPCGILIGLCTMCNTGYEKRGGKDFKLYCWYSLNVTLFQKFFGFFLHFLSYQSHYMHLFHLGKLLVLSPEYIVFCKSLCDFFIVSNISSNLVYFFKKKERKKNNHKKSSQKYFHNLGKCTKGKIQIVVWTNHFFYLLSILCFAIFYVVQFIFPCFQCF